MKLYDHQQSGVDFIKKCKGKAALFWDMGTGKTCTALSTFKLMRQYYPDLKMVVLCPLTLIEAAWQEDTAKFTDYKFGNLRTLKPKGGYDQYDVLCCNYETMVSQNRYRIFKEIIEKCQCFVVLDESSRIKNPKADTYKNLIKLRNNIKFRVVMSGTPCPNDYTELWTQINFIRPGLLPDSFYKFRNYFFHLARGDQRIQQNGFIPKRAMSEMFRKGWKYQLSDKKRDELFKIIEPYTYWLKKEDCITLPDTVDQVRLVTMTTEQKKAYKEMKNDLITFIEEQAVTAQVALTKLMKLRQITSNFLLTPEHEAKTISNNNPKLKALDELLEDIGDKQVIIWAVFKHDIKTIEERLLAHGVGTLYSGTDDKNQVIQDFKAGRIKYIVANPQSVAHGLTLVNCSYSIYYSLDYSWENYIQSKNRIHRIGQTKKCTYIHLLAENSIDQMIYETLGNKAEKNEIIENFMRRKK